MKFAWIRALADLPPVFDILLKITVLLTLAWIIQMAFRRKNPRWSLLLWRGVAVGIVLLPLVRLFPVELKVAAFTPTENVLRPTPPERPLAAFGNRSPASQPVSGWTSVRSDDGKRIAVALPAAPSKPSSSTDLERSRLPYHTLMTVSWGVVALCLAGRAMKSNLRLRKIVKVARPASGTARELLRRIVVDLKCTSRVELRCSSHAVSPVLTGLFNPVILLRESVAEADSAGDLPGILVHEVAHLRSGDLVWTRLLHVLSIFLWFHPLIWRVRGTHAASCEEVCDAVAADYLGDAEAYSGILARVALGLLNRRPSVGVIPMARKPWIRVRLELLKRNLFARRLRRSSAALSLLLGAVVLAVLGGLKVTLAQKASPAASGGTLPQKALAMPASPPPAGGFAMAASPAPARGFAMAGRPATRILRFPQDRSLGRLLVLDVDIDDSLDPFGHALFQWRYLQEAVGDVTVPAGKRVGLWIHPTALTDLSPLSALSPYDLTMLMINPYPASGVDPDEYVLPHLRGLTGLKTLVLDTMNTTERGLQFISGFKSLKHLRLSSQPITTPGASPQDFGSPAGMACLAELKALETLWLSSPRITDDGLSHLTNLPSLKELHLWSREIRGPGLSYLAKLPSLERLQLNLALGDAGLAPLKSIATLRELQISSFGITGPGLASLSGLTQLEALNLSQNPVTDQGIAHLKSLRSLKELNLNGTKITDDGLVHLKTMQSLNSLDLTQTAITDDGLPHLRAMSSLESLRLPEGVGDRGLADLQQLDQLRRLHLGGDITDAGLAHLANLRNLEDLHIRGRGVTNAGMSHVAALTSLRILKLYNCPIDNEGLAKLTALKSLENLSIQRAAITMSGVYNLNAMPNLTVLELYDVAQDGSPFDIGGLTRLGLLDFGKTRLRDQDLACLEGLTALKELYMLPQAGMTDDGIARLANVTSLERLGIGGSNLTDTSLSYLANMRKLDYLWIGDGDFTDRGLRYLEGLKGLRQIEITSHNAFSKSALDRLRSRLPDLQVVKIVP